MRRLPTLVREAYDRRRALLSGIPDRTVRRPPPAKEVTCDWQRALTGRGTVVRLRGTGREGDKFVGGVMRHEVEALSTECGANCSRSDAVRVLASDRGLVPEPMPLGHRIPLAPPLGAIFQSIRRPLTSMSG